MAITTARLEKPRVENISPLRKSKTCAVVVGQHAVDQIDSAKKIPASNWTRGWFARLAKKAGVYFNTMLVNG
jgi:hypothetical protein